MSVADPHSNGTAAMQSKHKSRKRLFDPSTVTTQAIDAFSQLHPAITRLHTTPPYHILILTPPTHPSSQTPRHQTTHLVSGGGDGHYPAHAGYIGAGMLTAVVSGGVFASPSAEAVAAAVQGVRQTRPATASTDTPAVPATAADADSSQAVDVLLVVKNYTGDKLNFRLALHLLAPPHSQQQPAPWTDMAVVGDDVALPRGQSIAGRRGLAGTLLVHKLAGAAAADGLSGQQVKVVAEAVATRLCTLGVAFTGCSLDGDGGEADMAEDEMELGLGIHGESGVCRQRLESVGAIIRRMVDMLLSSHPSRDYFWREAAGDDRCAPQATDEHKATDDVPIVLLVNNLAGMQQHELNVITQLALAELSSRQLRVERLVVGTLMTAWDMRGFSLTLLRLPADHSTRQQWLQWFNEPTDAPAWPASTGRPPAHQPPRPITLDTQPSIDSSASVSSSSSSAPFSPLVVPLLRAAAEALVSSSDELNTLDSRSGDGDCGSTFKQGAELLLHDLQSYPPVSAASTSPTPSTLAMSSPYVLFRSLRKYTAAMGGTSGAICSLLLLAAASSLASSALSSAPTSVQVIQALRGAADEVSRYSGAAVGDRTMLDALVPALDAASQAAQSDDGQLERVLAASVEAGVTGMKRTKSMIARAGRASYVRAELVRLVDPGAKAVCIVLQAMHDASKRHNQR